ncbi:MAG: DedA family protein [Bacteroidia bacterium]|nr:DedA family protein [Bacteroidia bacterium]MCF8425857.1 DedA family protein [Bacteroidia bacterium]MCF8445636.1 DedA family protein [Bacteroidia bacterium]
MEYLDYILHFDKHLQVFINTYGTLVYGLLFLIVFMETGLVVTPFLPGDSLLFAAGALAANEANNLSIGVIIVLLIAAALCGDNSNYFIGKYLAKKGEGAKLFGIFTIRKDYLDKTHSFYEKHGARTIILARFVPIVRTFAPFVAGVGSMTYKKYITYCIAGAVLWVSSIALAGYFFGSLPWIKANFEKVVFGIILISLLPVGFEIIKHKFAKK